MAISTAVPGVRRGLDPDARDRLAALAPRIDTGPLAGERVVPVHPALQQVLPQGLPRGASVRTGGHASVSAAFLLAAAASQAGAWTGVAGLPAVGLQACAEAGVVLERLVAVRDSGPGAGAFSDDTWGQVLGALVDGFDVVVFGAATRVRAGTARRVQSRLAHRGAVLLIVGAAGAFSCDIEVDTRASWEGLGDGHGHLRARRVEVSVSGRRIRRPQRDTLWFPGADGVVQHDVQHDVQHVVHGDVARADAPGSAAQLDVSALALRRTG